MRCPRCDAAQDQLMVLSLRGVPHHSAGHDTVYDWHAVFACPSCGNGDLRGFSHDCWKPPWEEEWDQEYSCLIPPADVEVLRTAIAGNCPKPLYPGCDCATHKSLNETHLAPGVFVVDEQPESERPVAHVRVDEAGIPAFTK